MSFRSHIANNNSSCSNQPACQSSISPHSDAIHRYFMSAPHAAGPPTRTRELLNTALHRRSPTSSVRASALTSQTQAAHGHCPALTSDASPRPSPQYAQHVKTPVSDRRRSHVMSAPHLAGPEQSSSDLLVVRVPCTLTSASPTAKNQLTPERTTADVQTSRVSLVHNSAQP